MSAQEIFDYISSLEGQLSSASQELYQARGTLTGFMEQNNLLSQQVAKLQTDLEGLSTYGQQIQAALQERDDAINRANIAENRLSALNAAIDQDQAENS